MADVEIQTVSTSNKRIVPSQFQCDQMLLEHIEGSLDESRKEAVENQLSSSDESKEQYQYLLRAIDYGEKLGEAQIDAEYEKHIAASTSWDRPSAKILVWSNWPVLLKSLIQAGGVAVLTALTVTQVPWERLPVFSDQKMTNAIELVQVDGKKQEKEIEIAPPALPAPIPKKEIVVAKNPTPIPQQKPIVVPKPKKPVVKKPDPVKVASTKNAKTKVITTKKSKTASVVPLKTGRKLEGVLFRIVMKVENLDKVAPDIASSLKKLGGKKAGKIELGTRFKGGRYFHFTISEKHHSAVEKLLSKYGNVRVKRDAHRRVMPKGLARYALWIGDAR